VPRWARLQAVGREQLRLIPREERFFELFAEQASNIVKGADLLVELVVDHTRAGDLRQQIEEVEHEGDIVTHEIADRLNRTFVTPFDHEDIHSLAGRMDDVLDNIEATADRMFLYEAGPASEDMVGLARVLADAAKALKKGIAGMPDISRNARRILDHCIEIHRLENIGDEESRHALAQLFKGSDALHALKWKEIYDHVENAIDKCEDVASIVEGIVVKHT
jgi:predicted phosphate transport protein (TIGR00153 family)